MPNILLRGCALVFIVLLCCRGGHAQDKPLRVVVDSIHAHNALQTPDAKSAYSYHTIYGFRRAFDFLRGQNVQVDEVSSGQIDDKTLDGCHLLFINLVSGDLPPFRVAEIAAIKKYLEAGGGLLLITDHTNAYYHAYKLWPLLDELGIEIRTETAAERAPATLGEGNGWIAITRFAAHPVTKGLRAVAFETGGTVDDRYRVATTSPQSWGDEWQHRPYGEGEANSPGASPGFFGDWKQNKGERVGPLGVIAAKNVGKGRVVIVADQNIFGDPFINYADNYRLWLNAVAWTSGDEKLADATIYERQRKGRVLAYEQYSRAAFGNGALTGHYNLFVALGRKMWLFAGDDLTRDADLLVFARDDYQLSLESLNGVERHLRAHRNIFILDSEKSARGGLLEQLQTRLGEPTVSQSEAAGYVVEARAWPECGEVFILPSNQPFQNSVLPAPEVRPNARQQLILDALTKLMQKAMQPAQ